MSTWLSMAEFDPSKLALVHDKLNDQMIDWEPERHGTDYKAGHRDLGDGVIEWDGLLLDGWKPLWRGPLRAGVSDAEARAASIGRARRNQPPRDRRPTRSPNPDPTDLSTQQPNHSSRDDPVIQRT